VHFRAASQRPTALCTCMGGLCHKLKGLHEGGTAALNERGRGDARLASRRNATYAELRYARAHDFLNSCCTRPSWHTCWLGTVPRSFDLEILQVPLTCCLLMCCTGTIGASTGSTRLRNELLPRLRRRDRALLPVPRPACWPMARRHPATAETQFLLWCVVSTCKPCREGGWAG
jgi:hypothetical protein